MVHHEHDASINSKKQEKMKPRLISSRPPDSVPSDSALPLSSRRARQPLRERGRTRFQLLLEATEALLLEHSPDDIGLYQIAKHAGVAPASVYHFLPTTNAALLALAERFHADIRAIMDEPMPSSRLISWQDLLAIRHERAVDYYNAHLPAAKIFLGIHPSWEIHQADKDYNRRASQTLFEYFDRFFVMPYVKDPQPKFEIMYSIADAVWAISFERHSKIVPQYADEAFAACIAYCRTFLPERVERRPLSGGTEQQFLIKDS
jgi:AcrR family transcriptional regulator